MIRIFRSAFLALVIAALVASSASALPHAGRPAPAPVSGLAAAWHWIVSLLAPSEPVAKAPAGGIMTKAGSVMDSSGLSFTGTNGGNSAMDAGSQMDPNGAK